MQFDYGYFHALCIRNGIEPTGRQLRKFERQTGTAWQAQSRLGTPSSGFRADGRGWNLGGSVEMSARGELDTAVLALTGGSNNGARSLGIEIAAFEEPDGRVRFIVRLPGGVELRGFVGEKTVRAYAYAAASGCPSVLLNADTIIAADQAPLGVGVSQ